jgi:hypothetical protein
MGAYSGGVHLVSEELKKYLDKIKVSSPVAMKAEVKIRRGSEEVAATIS